MDKSERLQELVALLVILGDEIDMPSVARP